VHPIQTLREIRDVRAARRPDVGECCELDTLGPLTRADLHVHSSASSKPVNRLVGALTEMPECYTTPEEVFDMARARGMDLVAITDHDTVAGALELADRGFEGVIVGEEVSVRFPEDGCLLHVLVWGLDGDLDDQISRLNLRDDVYAFADWLHHHNLPHSFAHPLYVQNGKLTTWHLERAALLFKGWEVLNGAHTVSHRAVLETYLRRLTPARVQALKEKHSLEPRWTRIWQKAHTGGSDDHARLNIGRTWTGVRSDTGRKVVEPAEFLRLVMAGHAEAGGVGGHASLLAHQLTTVATNWFGREKAAYASTRSRFVASRFLRFAGVEIKSPSAPRLVAHELKRKTVNLAMRRRRRKALPLLKSLAAEVGPVLDRHPTIAANLDPKTWGGGAAVSQHESMAAFVEDLTEVVMRSLRDGTIAAAKRRDSSGLTDHLVSYALTLLAQGPYIFSLFHQNKERPMLERLAHDNSEPGDGVSPLDRPMKVLQFTDTLGDVNGVSRFIQNVAKLAYESSRDLTVVTSTRFKVPDYPNIKNFEPVFAMPMPKYEQLDTVLPPLLRMLRWADEQRPDVIHISTPGAVGVVGFIAAKMLRVPIVGTYHTDFPSYIDKLFDDAGFTKACELYMKLFYKPFARVFARSGHFIDEMHRVGIDGTKIKSLVSGIDMTDFGDRFVDRSVWSRLSLAPARSNGHAVAKDPIRVLYCGRVSVEKNLPLLTRAWKGVREQARGRGIDAELIVIGDGPYRKEMQLALKQHGAHFLGFRHGVELATLYASSDLFVFPSATDTLGQAVMEAQASGLPALVSDQGGPKSIVRDGESGYVLPAGDAEAWQAAAVELITDAAKRRRMSEGAIAAMSGRDIRESFEHYWREHEHVWLGHLKKLGVEPKPGQLGFTGDEAQHETRQPNAMRPTAAGEATGA
jgi:glycosyltransferase involved in cell wall biosynthesis/predicted metal-dependent phosphoesterase TrpH